jgi:hypothetical protein
MDERAISFGSFRLLPSQRRLLEGNQPVRLVAAKQLLDELGDAHHD